MIDVGELVSDYCWLPHRVSAAGDQIQFVRLERADHRAVTFLEDKYLHASVERRWASTVAVAAEVERLPVATPVHFLFHSSLALSTLASRLFDNPGVAMALKEPIVLNEIATLARRHSYSRTLLSLILRLLARPFGEGEAVVIKPGNVANNLIPELLTIRPEAHALILYSPLPMFLRSIAKRGLWGRTMYRRFFALLHKDRIFDPGFSAEDIFEQTDLQIAAMVWLNHQAQFAQIVAQSGTRIRTIDSETFLARKSDALSALAAHFKLEMDVAELMAGPAFNQHSKELGRAFDAEARQRELDKAEAMYGEEIAMVTEWVDAVAQHSGVPLVLGRPLVA